MDEVELDLWICEQGDGCGGEPAPPYVPPEDAENPPTVLGDGSSEEEAEEAEESEEFDVDDIDSFSQNSAPYLQPPPLQYYRFYIGYFETIDLGEAKDPEDDPIKTKFSFGSLKEHITVDGLVLKIRADEMKASDAGYYIVTIDLEDEPSYNSKTTVYTIGIDFVVGFKGFKGEEADADVDDTSSVE